MRKSREVLRLAALGLAQHQIAKACSIVQSTVHKHLKLAKAANVSWPLPDDLIDQKLDALLFGKKADPPSRRIHPAPDYAAIHKQLQLTKTSPSSCVVAIDYRHWAGSSTKPALNGFCSR